MTPVTTLMNMKQKGDKITMLTCYDYSMAKLMDNAGVDTLLVGDSLGMTILGYEDTLSVTMEDMIHHTAAVARGAKNALVIGDMPFMSYQVSVEQAVINAGRLIKEGRAQMVKLEGGASVCPQFLYVHTLDLPHSQLTCLADLKCRVRQRKLLKKLLTMPERLKLRERQW